MSEYTETVYDQQVRTAAAESDTLTARDRFGGADLVASLLGMLAGLGTLTFLSALFAAGAANIVLQTNLLNQEGNGMALARSFVQPANAAKVRGRSEAAAGQKHDKLAGVDYTLSERAVGCPVLEDALAYLECEAERFEEVGDHVLVFGRVLYGEVLNQGEPLTSTYTGWSYSG